MRKYVSLLLFLCLLIMGISGVVLYIMPHGRIAYWIGWKFWGLDKDQWGNIHIVFGFIMVVLGIWHLVINWRAFLNYIKGSLGLFASKEFGLSLILVLLIFVGTVAGVYPFKILWQLEEKIKNSWVASEDLPPVPHAEKLSITKIAQMLGVSPYEVVAFLKSKGFKIENAFQSLGDVARKNSITPAVLYKIISVHFSPKRKLTGIGKLSVDELCKRVGLSSSDCIKVLREKGFEASLSDKVKAVSSRYGMTPYEFAELLKRK